MPIYPCEQSVGMSTPNLRLKTRFSASTIVVVLPLFICVTLNALLRPWLAQVLGGTMVRSGAGVRGSDRWWTFDPATHIEHPILTGFLSLSDGALGMLTLAAIAVLLLGLWLISRFRRAMAKH